MTKNFINWFNQLCENYAKGGRKSWLYGAVLIPSVILIFVRASQSGIVAAEFLAGALLSCVAIGLSSVVIFETKNIRNIPFSICIMVAFGWIIIGSLAGLIEHTSQERMEASIKFMIRFGIYGTGGAIIGVWIHNRQNEKIAETHTIEKG